MPANPESLGFLIADAARLLRRRFQERLEASGLPLTLAQARALIHLARNEGLRQVDLAELLEIQPITVARLVDQLADADLVERRADPDDRRAYRLHLRPAAKAQLVAIDKVASALRKDAVRGLDAAQTEALLAGLHALRANLAAR